MRPLRIGVSVRCMIVLVALAAVGMVVLLRLSDPVPARWDPSKFRSAVIDVVDPEGRCKVDIELLAWRTEEDERPLLVDSALAWARMENGKKVRWALLELYRHPRESAEWHLSTASHTPDPVQVFERPPGNDEIDRFVDGLLFSDFFGPSSSGFRTLASGVRMSTWYHAVGERPTRFFP